MTPARDTSCPERQHDPVYRACTLHLGLRHLRQARAALAQGDLATAADLLADAYFDLGNSGADGRRQAWMRLCRAAATVRGELRDAIRAGAARGTRNRRRGRP